MIPRKTIKELHNNLERLDSIVRWDRESDFYFHTDMYWYIMQCKLQSMLINAMFRMDSVAFPSIPVPERFKGPFTLDELAEFYAIHRTFWNCADLFYSVSAFEFESIFLGVYEEDHLNSLCKFPSDIAKELDYNIHMLTSSESYIDFECAIRIPGYASFKKELSEELTGLVSLIEQILASAQPCFLYGGRQFLCSENGDAYLHFLFYSRDEECGGEMWGEMCYLNLAVFYALYALHICMEYQREGGGL